MDIQRRRILDAAGELFNQRGYKSVTIHDIAEALGMSKKFKKVEECIRIAQQMGHVKETIDPRTATVFLETLQGLGRSDLSRQGISKFQAVDTLIDIFISGIAKHSP